MKAWIGRTARWTVVACALAAASAGAATVTAVANGNWSESATWSAVPQPGDDVVIGSGRTVTQDVTSVWFNNFTNSGTLVFLGTNTALQATNVTVNGTITHLVQSDTNGAFGVYADWTPDHRVWIVCSNLIVNAGKSIDATGKGYQGGGATTNGCGPGAGGFTTNLRGGGGGYGGAGGKGEQGVAGKTYGQADSVEPGSGGAGARAGSTGTGGFGGGWVTIDASGPVVVNGTIAANGNAQSDNQNESGGGSGGGIRIGCDTLSGNGTLSVNGGSSTYGGGGGGGRLALAFNSATGWSGTIRMDRGGNDYGVSTYSEMGTLWFTNTTLLPMNATNHRWRIYGVSSWSPDSFTVNKSTLSFEAPGLTLTVTNHLIVTNVGVLKLGYPNSNGVSTVTVGGDLRLASTGTLWIYAAATNGLGDLGATIDVAGTYWVGARCTNYFYSHNTNGGSTRVRAGAVTVETNGVISADSGGWMVDFGLGKGYKGSGGGYGGQGGSNSWNAAPGVAGGLPYGDANMPVLPGSGGGSHNNKYVGSGGGLIWLLASNGTVRVDGKLTARGANDAADRSGGGSGGGIYVVCSTLSGGGTIDASGGGSPLYTGGGGGGGRIAVWMQYSNHTISCVATGGLGGTTDPGRPASNGKDGTVVMGQRAAGPLIGNRGAANVAFYSATAEGLVISTGTAATAVAVYWGLADGSNNAAAWANTNTFEGSVTNGQILATNLTGLASGTKYYYRFFASNAGGSSWADSTTNFTTTAGLPVVSNAVGGTTDIQLNSATLNGYLASTGTAPTTVTVYWGPADGGTNAAAWANTNTFGGNPSLGAIATNVSLGASGIYYFYTFFASNSGGVNWATPSVAFVAGNVTLAATDSAAAEKGAAKTGAFTVYRPTTATNLSLTVNYTISGTASNGADYEPLSGSVVIPAGATNANIVVTPRMDAVNDPGETVVLTLTTGAYRVGSPSSDTVTIQDMAPDVLNTWGGAGLWSSHTNWSDEMPPIGSQAVVIDGAVLLDQATAAFPSLTNWGTLTFRSTNAILYATDVVITGTVTHEVNSDTNGLDGWAMDNRIRMVCSNLTVTAGGAIHGDGKGYAGGIGNGVVGTNGCGPGGGGYSTIRGNGAGYGGYGGVGGYGGPRGEAYGQATPPFEPGSGGGGGREDNSDARGGGLVWIEAADTVRLDGRVSANGNARVDFRDEAGGGSGGGIHIVCARLAGAGAIRAVGGASSVSYGGAGGGGRIAVYAPDASGWSGVLDVGAGDGSTAADRVGQDGTAYIENTALIPPVYAGRKARIYGITAWSPDWLVVSNATLAFEDSPMALTVSNGVVVQQRGFLGVGGPGLMGALSWTVGGSLTVLSNSTAQFGTTNMSVAGTMTVGRDLVLSNGANQVHVWGGQVPAPSEEAGTVLAIGGAVDIGSNSVLYVGSHPTNGGSVRLSAAGITVRRGGRISADGRGFGSDQGPGAGRYGAGGGYGGVGGNASWQNTGWPLPPYSGGGVYGSSNTPALPGSGGGRRNMDVVPGGGLVCIETRDGTLTVDGSITAIGVTDSGDRNGGGSGGGIYLVCKTFEGAGALSADGGGSPSHSGGGGGGGRIAVWAVRYNHSVTTTVSGGAGGTEPGSTAGSPGTMVWGQLGLPGTIIMIR